MPLVVVYLKWEVAPPRPPPAPASTHPNNQTLAPALTPYFYLSAPTQPHKAVNFIPAMHLYA